MKTFWIPILMWFCLRFDNNFLCTVKPWHAAINLSAQREAHSVAPSPHSNMTVTQTGGILQRRSAQIITKVPDARFPPVLGDLFLSCNYIFKELRILLITYFYIIWRPDSSWFRNEIKCSIWCSDKGNWRYAGSSADFRSCHCHAHPEPISI